MPNVNLKFPESKALRLLACFVVSIALVCLLVITGGLEPYYAITGYTDLTPRLYWFAGLCVAAMAVILFPTRYPILLAILVGFGLRLLFTFAYFGTWDLLGFIRYQEALQAGQDLYLTDLPQDRIYNYTPAIAAIHAKAIEWYTWLHPEPLFEVMRTATAIKLPTAIADLLVMLLLWLLCRQYRLSARATFTGITLYAFNPHQILISSYQPQFENIALVFVLLALWMDAKWKVDIASALCLGVGIAIKHDVVIFLLPFLVTRKTIWRALVFAMVVMLPLAAVVWPAYRVAPDAVGKALTGYAPPNGLFSIWVDWLAPQAASLFRPVAKNIGLVMTALALLFVCWSQRQRPLPKVCLLCATTFALMTPGFAGQYLTMLYVFLPFWLTLEQVIAFVLAWPTAFNFFSHWQSYYGGMTKASEHYSVPLEKFFVIAITLFLALLLTRLLRASDRR